MKPGHTGQRRRLPEPPIIFLKLPGTADTARDSDAAVPGQADDSVLLSFSSWLVEPEVYGKHYAIDSV